MGFVARFTASVTQYAFFVARAASALLLFHLIRPAGRQPPSPTPCRPAQKPKLRQQLSRSPRRFPPAPRTRDTGPRAAWPIVQTSRVVSPLLSGTILSLPPAAHRPLAQHPHSPSLPLLPPRTVAAHLVLPRRVDLATTMAPAQTDPNAAFESSSQPPSSGCCDDHLSPLCEP